MASTTIIRAKTSFAFDNPDGVPISIREGETFHKDSPRLDGLSEEARDGSFESFTPDHDVEQATAAPGEKRGGRRSKKASADATKESEQATAAPGESESTAASEDAGKALE